MQNYSIYWPNLDFSPFLDRATRNLPKLHVDNELRQTPKDQTQVTMVKNKTKERYRRNNQGPERKQEYKRVKITL